jgi:FAD/FMN-containing dehydrogenase
MVDRRQFLKSAAGAASLAAGSYALARSSPRDKLAGKITFKGESHYEALRQAASFNARKPNRYPEAIVLPAGEEDVVAAVKLARERGWQVTARSGGHAWSGSHTQDHSLQINLARMSEIRVDEAGGIVAVSPSVYGNVLNKKLREDHQLFTPTAHGVNVGIGGFVMCGGHGWNSRVFGLGCANLKALDVVTSKGDLIHASDTENSDYYWAARGSGPGFFGVAVRYYMQLHPKPRVMRTVGFIFGISECETVIGWVRETMAEFPRCLEVVLIGKELDGAPVLQLSGHCLADSDEEVDAASALLLGCPAIARARQKWVRDIIVPFDVEPPTDINPTGARFAVDNIWTNASSDALLPFMRPLLTDRPTPKSYIFMQVWGPVQRIPDMAYSTQADIYISSNAVYYDPSDDARCESWAVQAMRRLDGISAGAQMNDENIEHHPAHYLSDAAYRRLESLRRKHDPERRFPGFIKPDPVGS